MDKQININIKSVFTSGLVAGITILTVGAGLIPIVGDQMDQVLASRNIPPLSPGSMVFFAFNSMIFGQAIVLFYALVHSKFKKKCNAIIVVTLSFWFFTYFLSSAALVAYGFMPLPLVAIGTAWGLLELFVATIISSKLYKDVKVK
ncbi:MAG: hypothetical protein PF485_08860 [Bacteroidales bacterium]|jgi:hypothetical protein|nr:hypothetical protein [Bacteroidales bacterium]